MHVHIPVYWLLATTFASGLLLLSLAMDGATGPNQDAAKEKYGATGPQIMYYCNAWALVSCH